MSRIKIAIATLTAATAAAMALGVPAAHAEADSATARAVPPYRDGYLYVFSDYGFSGRSHRWLGDDGNWEFNGNAGNWNDRVSSIWNNGYAGHLDDVIVWEHTNYRGASFCLPNGSRLADLRLDHGGWDNRISSHKWVNCR